MKILALHGSKYGQAEAVLRRVARRLQSDGHAVDVVSGKSLPHAFRVEDFDAVVIAASVLVGRHPPYIRRFVRERLGTLALRPTAFISVNGASPESSPRWRATAREYVDRFLLQTGWRPRWSATFSGALRYTRYDPLTRWIMKRISRKVGGPIDTSRDYEFTDWDAVDRFAARLSHELDVVAFHPAA